MHSRASQVLAQHFRKRGAQAELAKRTGIPQPRLSKLAGGATETTPTLEICIALRDDPEVKIDLGWWLEEVSADDTAEPADKGAA